MCDNCFISGNIEVGIATAGQKSVLEGKSLYLSGHVGSLLYHGISPNISYCFVKTTVVPQTRISEDPYDVWVAVHKESGTVSTAHCTCLAGYVKANIQSNLC